MHASNWQTLQVGDAGKVPRKEQFPLLASFRGSAPQVPPSRLSQGPGRRNVAHGLSKAFICRHTDPSRHGLVVASNQRPSHSDLPFPSRPPSILSLDLWHSRRRPPTILSFFFNDTATTEIYTLSLHDALPISIVATNACFQLADFTGRGRGKSSSEGC